MFHQVGVPSSDIDALRFFCTKGTDKDIEDKATRVYIFGKTDSPCAANWALKQPPSDYDYYNDNYNNHTQILIISMWMIFFYSMNCKLKLNKLCIRLINILSSHGFNLTKWMPNHPDMRLFK